MSGRRTKQLRRALIEILGRAPTISEFRFYKKHRSWLTMTPVAEKVFIATSYSPAISTTPPSRSAPTAERKSFIESVKRAASTIKNIFAIIYGLLSSLLGELKTFFSRFMGISH